MTADIESVDAFVKWVFETPNGPGETSFFRGHSKADKYKLVPNALRSAEERVAEPRKHRKLLIANPADFRHDRSTFERLARMQHYGLPTRLLDTSTNPLIALFFACRSNPDFVGEVIRLTLAEKDVKYFDSDTVSVLANLALLDDAVREELKTGLNRDAFNAEIPVIKLLHFIKEEKPYFRDVIEPSDLGRVLCVRGRQSNERVTAQAGAFLLFGQAATLPESGNAEIAIRRIRIAGGSKGPIIDQLDTLSINPGTAFRDIGKTAEYIAERG